MRKEILYSLAGLTLALLVIYSNFLFLQFAKPLSRAEDYTHIPLESGIKESSREIIKPFVHDLYSLSHILIISFIIAFTVYFITRKKLKV
ncbi:MAG: hypothetical protein QXG01_06265 [Candidatus Bathyarchaeia archaeon]